MYLLTIFDVAMYSRLILNSPPIRWGITNKTNVKKSARHRHSLMALNHRSAIGTRREFLLPSYIGRIVYSNHPSLEWFLHQQYLPLGQHPCQPEKKVVYHGLVFIMRSRERASTKKLRRQKKK